MLTYVIVAVVAYFLGSIPFGYLLVRSFKHQDIRQTGSGNIGATNVMRTGSKGLGIATLALDALKGFAAVVMGRLIDAHSGLHTTILVAGSPDQVQQQLAATGIIQHWYLVAVVAAMFAILGHIFPVWLKFKGGKGVATGVGTFLAIAPKAVALVLLIFLAVVAVSRYVSLGSIVATAVFPLFAWLLYRGDISPTVFAPMVFTALLIIGKHHQNIRRLLAGTEHRLDLKKGSSA